MDEEGARRTERSDVRVRSGSVELDGILRTPERAKGLVIFAHGSGSSRLSRRNNFVAEVLESAGLASLLFDLLTNEEEGVDQYTRELRFDIDLLAERLIGATDWAAGDEATAGWPLAYFGASTGAAAALQAAARLEGRVSAVVSRGGRPDLAAEYLPRVRAPTLLIVGGDDVAVLEMNREAYGKLACERELAVVTGATHLFEEPGALEEVARLATSWFLEHLSTEESGGNSD